MFTLTRIETTNWLLPERLIASFLVLVLSEMAQSSYNFGTNKLEGSSCNKGASTIPEMYVVNSTALKCIFRHPIWWDVQNDVGADFRIQAYGNDTTRSKLDWKSCNSSNQMTGTITDVTVYFETVIVNVQPDVISFNVSCVSAINSAQSHAKWIPGQNATLVEQNNSKEGMVKFQNQSKAPCLHVILASDYKHSKFGCIVGFGRQSNSSGAQYLECTDWIKCKQRVSQTFKGICKGVLTRDLCNTAKSCANRSSAFNSGIIYCGNGTEEDPAFYMLSFMSMKTETGDYYSSRMISDDDGGFNGKSLVSLKSSWTAYGYEQKCTHDKPVILDCAAPKFLALERFQWTASYVGGSSIDIRKACRTTHGSANDTYIETLSCVLPSEDAPRYIQVNCTVHLQSGYPVTNTVTKKCPAVPSLLDEELEHALFSIGGVVGCLLLTLPFLIFYYCKVQRQKKQLNFSAEEVDNFMNGTAMLTAENEAQPTATVLPYDVNLEVPRSQILIGPKILGQGAFGKVMKGRIGDRDVAIKTTNKNVDCQYFRALLSELKIMTFVGKHPNVMELVGANTERINKLEVYLIFEFCENGNMLDYIRLRRDQFVNQFSEDVLERNINSQVVYVNGANTRIRSEDLIRWSVEIASGMAFISSKNVYHGDLAARNILLKHNLVAKLGDFGLARDLKDYSLYVQRAGCPLPLKWMSIEALRDLEFSIQSDVWSFGITLWEIFSLGSTPYPGMEWNFQAWKRLLDGERMDRPFCATESIYGILLKCWESRPQDRPTFAELKNMLEYELEKIHALNL